MREKILERKLTEAVKAMGGIAPKFVSPGFDGMPDRLVLLPDGKCAFVEVKRRGEKSRPLQEARHGMLRRLGFEVYVLDDYQQIGGMLREISTA
ncbi:nuclease [Dehalococcoides mccartyi]|uniref:VRR-NUC domain-containing protein n=1 Tax=Dehalococcoides mccartyi TaxID=61435 RepID=UPI00098EDAF0|nr:VRR-NUC domain-containing protein [Dehalococcoides mccartyi]AQU05387.1 nuclease [Dehalococcoides mccartyi]AQU06840.1 nuclease [Dehalococcoides mccartyi]